MCMCESVGDNLQVCGHGDGNQILDMNDKCLVGHGEVDPNSDQLDHWPTRLEVGIAFDLSTSF